MLSRPKDGGLLVALFDLCCKHPLSSHLAYSAILLICNPKVKRPWNCDLDIFDKQSIRNSSKFHQILLVPYVQIINQRVLLTHPLQVFSRHSPRKKQTPSFLGDPKGVADLDAVHWVGSWLLLGEWRTWFRRGIFHRTIGFIMGECSLNWMTHHDYDATWNLWVLSNMICIDFSGVGFFDLLQQESLHLARIVVWTAKNHGRRTILTVVTKSILVIF